MNHDQGLVIEADPRPSRFNVRHDEEALAFWSGSAKDAACEIDYFAVSEPGLYPDAATLPYHDLLPLHVGERSPRTGRAAVLCGSRMRSTATGAQKSRPCSPRTPEPRLPGRSAIA
jgi:hypothetical protein